MQGGGGCWTSPGEHDICECLGSGEEGKDDPVHHPFHLNVQRAVLAGALGKHPGPLLVNLLEALCRRAQRAPTLSVGMFAGGRQERANGMVTVGAPALSLEPLPKLI